MNTIFNANTIKIINITPFKVSLCGIIHEILKKNINKHSSREIDLFDELFLMINDFKCEISLKIFKIKIQKAFKYLTLRFSAYSSHFRNPNYFFLMLSNFLQNLHSVNEIYEFFNYKLRELKNKSELKNSNLLEIGGYFDLFIRKCIVSFYKMSFEELTILFEKIVLYNQQKLIDINITMRESSSLFEKQINEYKIFSNNSQEFHLNDQLLLFNNYKQKYYFTDQMFKTIFNNKLQTNNNFYENKFEILKERLISYLDPKSADYVYIEKDKNQIKHNYGMNLF